MTTDARDQALAKAKAALETIEHRLSGTSYSIDHLVIQKKYCADRAREAIAIIDALTSAPPQPTTMRTEGEIQAEIERLRKRLDRDVSELGENESRFHARMLSLEWVLSADKKETGR